MSIKVAVVGGGACGLVGSIFAKRAGAEVVVFERTSRFGKKILASGNGRCNITNENISLDFYHGKYPHFAKYAIKFDTKEFFNSLGLELRAKKGTRLYPLSDQASIVLDMLLYEAQRIGVKLQSDSEIEKLSKRGEKFILNNSLEFDRVILACGSSAMPHISGTKIGYDLAMMMGHKIQKPFASLVQLVSSDETFFKASGVRSVANIDLFVDDKLKMSQNGDLLFTNYGLSGSAILDLSRTASFALLNRKKVHLIIDLLPHISHDELKHLMQKRGKIDLPIDLWLGGLINKKLVNPILKKASLNRGFTLNKKSINSLVYAIKSLKIDIVDTKGYKKAEVMAGGVDTKDIDPKTMESKLHNGLYFCGEMLDIDGDCGGYNLHWAWGSGYIAGSSAGKA